MSAGLVVRDAVVRYGSVTAVDEVSLHVAPGEVVALLGPSGCGKSSLLRAVAGLEPLAGGSVSWDGEPVDGVPVHRRGFGLMFQDGQLFTHRDVSGNVAYGLRTTRLARPSGPRRSGPVDDDRGAPVDGARPVDRARRVDELLELVGLAGYGPRPVATLSGGERQRVALARALAPAPRLLLLDEPLSALDRALRERLAVDLRAVLVATGTTAVFVTHDQDEAFAVADRVAVMRAGRLLQVDAPADLWRRPASRDVAEFLGYEAFVAAGSAAAGPLTRALAGTPDGSVAGTPAGALGRALRDDDVVALAEGAFVVRTDPGAVKGAVQGVTSRRGRTEVRVEVEGIGVVTALAPVGARFDTGTVLPLAVDADALAVLPGDSVRR